MDGYEVAPVESPTWFKFLLDEHLLDRQLINNKDVSQTIMIISTFLHQADISLGILRDIKTSENLFGENDAVDNSENNRIRCLKLLAAKTASWISWNLEYIHKYLPVNHVHTLLMFLVKLSSLGDSQQRLNPDLNVDAISPVALFALNLFCCWSLKFIVEESLPSKPSKVPHVQIPGLFDPCINLSAAKESIFKMVQEHEGDFVILLEKILTSQHEVADMPTMKCFMLQSGEDRIGFCDWSHCQRISSSEIFSQASYSLGCFFFLRRRYHPALLAFECCQRSFSEVKDPKFMKISMPKVDGYLRACKGVLKLSLNVPLTLHEQIKKSIINNYHELSSILMIDLERQELSLSFRYEMEDKAIAEQLSKKSLYVEVLSCNIIKRILDNRLMAHQLVKIIIANNSLINFFMKTCRDICFKVSEEQQTYLKEFLKYLSNVLGQTLEVRDILLSEPLRKLFDERELRILSFSPTLLPVMSKCSLPFLESTTESTKIVNLEQKLLTSYDATKINEILYGLVGVVGKYNLLFLSDRWHLPMDLHATMETISLNHLHLSTVFNTLIAKSKICQQLEMFRQSRELLDHIDARLRETTFYKLMKLLKWEILVIDLLYINSSQNVTLREKSDLLERAKNCLTSIHLEPDLQPSHESLRLSILQLLNNEEWEFLISISSSNEIVQFGHMIGGLCKELNQLKTAKTLARNFIEFIALIFSTPSKRPLQGVITRDYLLNFISLIINETILSVFVSCLTKLLRFADQNMSGDIFSDYVIFWPLAITNTMLDKNAILEAVYFVLDRAMVVNDRNISCIKTNGDLFFALKQYHISLRYYIYLGIIGTDYFTEPITRNIYDDQIYRKMIQACIHLNCFTQAAIMCQFLDEVDYSTAFKCIAERPILDGGDMYYNCVWDTTILEFIINSHQRNAEIEKLGFAHHLMKTPEMNGNKKEEAFQEISKIKKKKFFRKMTNQYLGTARLMI